MKINIKRFFWLTLIVILALIFRALFELAFTFYSDKYSLTQFLNISFHVLLSGFAVLIFLGIVIWPLVVTPALSR